MVKTPDDIANLWRQYRRRRDAATRNRLIVRYLPLVKMIADQIFARLPRHVDVRDLRAAGVFGLISAVEAFDHDRGIKFETYCSVRVRGSVIDELRAQDWVPRTVRSRTQKFKEAENALMGELGRGATDDEVARRLGVGEDALRDIGRECASLNFVSLSTTVEDGEGSTLRLVDLLTEENPVDPMHRLALGEVASRVRHVLPQQEHVILTLYYYDGLTMKEIADFLDLSESRICQIHTQALDRLREELGAVIAELV
ncbi:MAG: FliA/WhiG family RNA polymerase sigma factor [Planctomycetes bacterium]|nr:FliA/WhiG family RNA polymerase sigma factor [Planctomycetota bacterium]